MLWNNERKSSKDLYRISSDPSGHPKHFPDDVLLKYTWWLTCFCFCLFFYFSVNNPPGLALILGNGKAWIYSRYRVFHLETKLCPYRRRINSRAVASYTIHTARICGLLSKIDLMNA